MDAPLGRRDHVGSSSSSVNIGSQTSIISWLMSLAAIGPIHPPPQKKKLLVTKSPRGVMQIERTRRLKKKYL